MANIQDYIRNTAEANKETLDRIRRIQQQVEDIANDVESNAVAIEELAELIASEEV